MQTLYSNTPGGTVTAIGANALNHNAVGDDNPASGARSNTTGDFNTATGARALEAGRQALQYSMGNQNIAVGEGAGAALTTGNKTIYLGHPGVGSEIERHPAREHQKKTYVAGVATAAVTESTVVIDEAGQLGTQLSSARYKRDITPMGASRARVRQLRRVERQRQQHVTDRLQRELAELRSLVGQMRGGVVHR